MRYLFWCLHPWVGYNPNTCLQARTGQLPQAHEMCRLGLKLVQEAQHGHSTVEMVMVSGEQPLQPMISKVQLLEYYCLHAAREQQALSIQL